MSERRVLVVDDDRQMVRTLCDILRLAGWEAVGADSGEQAVALAAASSFAVVVMDVRMAGMSGVEALVAIRERHRAMPVVLMTAYAAPAALAEAETAGAARIFAKPVPVPRLLTLLGQLAASRRVLLVVDDDARFLDTLAQLLSDREYEVLTARSMTEAQAALRDRTPGVVLLDLRLGDAAPRDAVDAIRRAAPSAALVLVSGYPSLLEETAAAVPREWIVERLRKPVPPDRLTRLLDDVLA